MTASKAEEVRESIGALLETRQAAKQIAEAVGCSVPMVYKVAHERGHVWKLPKEPKPPRDPEDYARQKVAQVLPSFEYVDGYEKFEGSARIRCRVCGEITTRSWETIRHKKVRCRKCQKRETLETLETRIQRAEQQKRDNARRRAEWKAEREAEREAERIAKEESKKHPCLVCGRITSRKKYCSDRCANKARNKSKEIKRRSTIAGRCVDKDITVLSLYKRDGGICYLCGRPTRFEDYTERGGSIICGDWYPSIDHVIPLARGGVHSWDNVRLAHRRCNYLKSDSLPGGA